MSTLYVVGSPAGDLNDLTLRARRILDQVLLVVSNDMNCSQILAHHEIDTPVSLVAEPARAVEIEKVLEALHKGDVAFLMGSPATGSGQRLVRAARDGGFAVKSVPNPILPIPSLILSGLPADTFVYLGTLPEQTDARQRLLRSLAAERRTVVALVAPGHLAGSLKDLNILGDRPLVAMAPLGSGASTIWRGTINEAQEHLPLLANREVEVLVIGGSSGRVEPWSETQIAEAIRALQDEGLPAKEIGRRLAPESGWPRRKIYRLAVSAGRSRHSAAVQ